MTTWIRNNETRCLGLNIPTIDYLPNCYLIYLTLRLIIAMSISLPGHGLDVPQLQATYSCTIFSWNRVAVQVNHQSFRSCRALVTAWEKDPSWNLSTTECLDGNPGCRGIDYDEDVSCGIQMDWTMKRIHHHLQCFSLLFYPLQGLKMRRSTSGSQIQKHEPWIKLGPQKWSNTKTS